jgi:hypothetical protein
MKGSTRRKGELHIETVIVDRLPEIPQHHYSKSIERR